MRCPYCGAEVSGGKCDYCDSDLSYYGEPQPNINTENTARPFVNINIGAQNNTAEDMNVSPKKKSVCAVLCGIGFFRLAGLHRFYAGKIGTGILWLLTFGLCFVGTLVDFILILTGNFKDKDGKVIK